MKSFSRGQGHSATAAAAYRGGLAIADTRTGERHDYTRRAGVASVDMLAPAGAPAWCADPVAFWNANEAAETRANARVAREVEVSLPSELNAVQRHALAVDLGRLLIERYAVAALVAVHEPDRQGDARNHHAHILLSARQVGPTGLGGRAMAALDARQGAGAEAVRTLREAVAERINEHLERAGHAERVDHRSLRAQADQAEAAGDLGAAALLAREPTRHEGKAVTAATRRGDAPERAQENAAVRQSNRISLADYLAQAAAQARLPSTPAPHDRPQASAERRAEARSEAPATATPAPARIAAPAQPASNRPRVRPGAAPPPSLRASTGSGGRTVWASGRDAHILNAQAAQIEASRQAERAAAQVYLEGLDQSSRASVQANQAVIAAYAQGGALGPVDTAALVQHCAKDRRCVALLRQAIEAREHLAQAESRPLRRRNAHGEAMARTQEAQRQAEVIDGQAPSRWRPLQRREWAERRRAQRVKLAHSLHAEQRAAQATSGRAMDHYARQERTARQALDAIEQQRRTRITLQADHAADRATVDQAMGVFHEARPPEPAPTARPTNPAEQPPARRRPRLR